MPTNPTKRNHYCPNCQDKTEHIIKWTDNPNVVALVCDCGRISQHLRQPLYIKWLDILVDDYIRSKESGIMGRVLSFGYLGKAQIPGYKVEINGRVDFIATDDAQLLGRV